MTLPRSITRKTPTIVVRADALIAGATILGNSGDIYVVARAFTRKGTTTIAVEGSSATIAVRPQSPITVYSA